MLSLSDLEKRKILQSYIDARTPRFHADVFFLVLGGLIFLAGVGTCIGYGVEEAKLKRRIRRRKIAPRPSSNSNNTVNILSVTQ